MPLSVRTSTFTFPIIGAGFTFWPVRPSAATVEGDNGIARWRDLMGATDPAKAATGTIRKDFASSIEANSVHGSYSPETAAAEIPYFFSSLELHTR